MFDEDLELSYFRSKTVACGLRNLCTYLCRSRTLNWIQTRASNGVMELNRAQRQAVCTPCDSVLQILAGPGSGKTKVLTHRVCFLLQNGLRPENIILTTFTNVFRP